MTEVAGTRWRTAQEYERGYWARMARDLARDAVGELDFYDWRRGQLESLLQKIGRRDLAQGDADVLEIGSGPVGVVTFFPGERRVAIDPLESFYGENDELVDLRDDDVTYLEGVGEDIPCDNRSFDLVIIENCIDHVLSPAEVMDEIHRVLRRDGVLYLTVNCRTLWGFLVHRLLSRLRVDAGHPHTFTARRVQKDLLHGHGFRPLWLNEDSAFNAWLDDLRGPGFKPRAKALLGVSEHLVSTLAELERVRSDSNSREGDG